MYFKIALLIGLSSCQNDQPIESKVLASDFKKEVPIKTNIEEDLNKVKHDTFPDHLIYSFLKSNNSQTLRDIIKTPEGFTRIKVAHNSFAEWLRYLPAKDQNEKVKLYNGDLKGNQNAHVAIINIDIGKRDLQQCADAVMRLKAEYHYAKKEYSAIHFNFTSGHRVAFDDWSKGKKPKVAGNSVSFTNPGTKKDTSYPNFRKYMDMIFNYAGTASLTKELKQVAIKDMQIGDVFIQGGFPGHAVIIVDMAENGKGEKLFLLAQSYMPAQDIHILKNYDNEDFSSWYPLEFGAVLSTPEWRFNKGDLKRF